MMNQSTNPNEDLQAIRDIMERSSKFLSLSGLSGVFAGACALAGAAVAWFFIPGPGLYLALDAMLILLFAVVGAAWFSVRKAKKTGQLFWTRSTRRLLFHLLIPLVTGGIFTLILVFRNDLELIPAIMLTFYGLSLVNAGKFTFGEIHYLGLTEIGLGILAGIFMQMGLLFWVIGFGVMHIVYGTVMYYRHERQR